MLDDRKAAILRAVVEEYIETAQPVGSGHVVRAPGIGVSSATVRNDMAVLESEGYLQQPHTSAGRVPTEKGYRYFVDTLTGHAQLNTSSAQQVRAFFARAHGELEQMLHDTTRLLSDITDYASVVVGPQAEVAHIRSVQLVGLNPRVALAILVLSNGVVEKRTIEFGDDVSEDRLLAATAHLSQHLVGGTVAVVDNEMPRTGDAPIDAVIAAAMAALRGAVGADGDLVYVGGTSRMVAAFEAVESVRNVLTILEQQYLVVTLLRDVLDRGLHVAIGTETGMEPLAECSLVVAPYLIEGEQAGTIGVLGPTRMNYPQALAAVAVVSRRLGKHLSDG